MTKHVTFHSLRHTYASLLINEGVPLKVISDLLGHHSTAVTERYYAHLCDSVKKRAVELYLPVFGLEEKSNVVAIHHTN
ncbi:MAG: tyrosine-type recombinase/integrase [Candidatus Hydrogenedentes bacterium]|nr:tyrosine-type recombinase/integrase [Candidatus Hydrogenedentota bacterium]